MRSLVSDLDADRFLAVLFWGRTQKALEQPTNNWMQIDI